MDIQELVKMLVGNTEKNPDLLGSLMQHPYSTIGNLTNNGTWTYTWHYGRQLAGMSRTGTSVSFQYDHNGLRTQKAVMENGVTTTTNYIYNGKLLAHMTRGSDSMHFFYDAQGRPAMVDYNGTKSTHTCTTCRGM